MSVTNIMLGPSSAASTAMAFDQNASPWSPARLVVAFSFRFTRTMELTCLDVEGPRSISRGSSKVRVATHVPFQALGERHVLLLSELNAVDDFAQPAVFQLALGRVVVGPPYVKMLHQLVDEPDLRVPVDMVEKRLVYLNQVPLESGEDRDVGGVHFPADIDACIDPFNFVVGERLVWRPSL